ncbi:MAG: efflux RND transporter periplasmic adaptor subunit [Bryobacteraceae bacterium]
MITLSKHKFVIAGTAGVVVAGLLIASAGLRAKAPAKPAPLPAVRVAQVERKDVPIYVEWIGTLAGQVNADVQAQVAGYLLRRNYQEGSFVRKGQSLFEIDPRPFKAALDQAKGQLAQAGAQLGQGQAQLSTAEANQLKSQLDVDKYTPLTKAEAASQQDLDNAVQTNRANQAQVKAAEAAIAAAKAQIQTSEAAVETASINLGFTQIASPIDGVADVARAQVGDLVGPSSGALTTVSTLDPIRDYFTVSEQDYLQLRKRLSTSDGGHWKLRLILADGTTYAHEGAFYFTGRAVDQNTGTIQVAALFPNPGNVLRPGQFGKVRAVVRTLEGALLVPQSAINELQGTYQVDVVGPDDKIAVRPVQVGERIGTDWIVLEGLQPGQRVVIEGQQNLRPGTQVQPKP